jgi:hypothetical protein
VAIAVAGLAISSPAAAWAGGGPIGPNQHFHGLVNGKRRGAVITVVCPGPTNTGYATGGQTTTVTRVVSGGGDTGSTGHVIYALFPGSPGAGATFTSYDTPMPISTSAPMPCGGTGEVLFSSCPLPAAQACGIGSRIDVVKVTFLNLGV